MRLDTEKHHGNESIKTWKEFFKVVGHPAMDEGRGEKTKSRKLLDTWS